MISSGSGIGQYYTLKRVLNVEAYGAPFPQMHHPDG
jgi:hypothetical protein